MDPGQALSFTIIAQMVIVFIGMGLGFFLGIAWEKEEKYINDKEA